MTIDFGMQSSKVGVRRFASGLVGVSLLLSGLYTAYNLGEQAYYDYFFYPKVKEGYIKPTRWQDIVTLMVLWGGTILLLYLSYRLLKYAFRPQHAERLHCLYSGWEDESVPALQVVRDANTSQIGPQAQARKPK